MRMAPRPKDTTKHRRTIEQKIAEAESRLARLRQRRRRREAQGKIIVGARLVARAKRDPKAAAFLRELVSDPPLRPHERAAVDALQSAVPGDEE